MKNKIESVSTVDVFTPTRPATFTYVERNEINCQLVDALMTPGKQLIVYGFTGCGKTTLLRKKIDELYDRYISTSCTKSMTLDQIRRNAFDQLDRFFLTTKSNTTSNSISASYHAIKAEIAANKGEKYERIIPIQLNDQRLAEFLGEANCCWIIEDFHKVDKAEKEGLSQMMKVFMDMASTYKTVKIIAIGAVGTAKEVVDYDREMRNRIAEIHVKLMNIDELEKIIVLGGRYLNIHFPQDLINKITYYSNGLAALCHQMCLSMCFERGIYTTSTSFVQFNDNDFQKAVKNYIDQNSETLKSTFDKARSLEKGKDIRTMVIFNALITEGKDEITFDEINRIIKRKYPTFHTKSLRSILNKLTTPDFGEIFRYDNDGRYYFFSNPFFKVYVQWMMKDENKFKEEFPRISIKDLHAFLKAKKDMMGELPNVPLFDYDDNDLN